MTSANQLLCLGPCPLTQKVKGLALISSAERTGSACHGWPLVAVAPWQVSRLAERFGKLTGVDTSFSTVVINALISPIGLQRKALKCSAQ
ncbi:hypothetical protein SKAU_G00303240 [Synaphobranchus kaupii]|uniref:Uncharacterized protein n=1 Tax=Synaphobranchus kaupii TaxID=118154 RepID=A0A9Q1EW14_SYNKA|nr:hypothetical protein SKAU_G00303240 [Synaphobranchus kaupii]